MKTSKKVLAVAITGWAVTFVAIFAHDALTWAKCGDGIGQAIVDTWTLGAPLRTECNAVQLRG
jgi:hypothetical protein